MAQHGRMPRARRLVRIVGRRHAFAQVAAAVVGAVVLDAAAAHLGLERVGQRRPGGLHAEHPGVAAARRHFERIQHRGVGRQSPGSSCRCATPPRPRRARRSARPCRRARSRRRRRPDSPRATGGRAPGSAADRARRSGARTRAGRRRSASGRGTAGRRADSRPARSAENSASLRRARSTPEISAPTAGVSGRDRQTAWYALSGVGTKSSKSASLTRCVCARSRRQESKASLSRRRHRCT